MESNGITTLEERIRRFDYEERLALLKGNYRKATEAALGRVQAREAFGKRKKVA